MIFMMCRGQIITAGMGEVIDISIPAVRDAMDICEIKNRKDCLEKTLNLFRTCQKNRKLKDENSKLEP